MKNRRASAHTNEGEASRKIADLDAIIAQMERAAADLDRWAEAEETRTKSSDPTEATYSTFAKSARQRANKLRASVGRLKMEIEAARAGRHQ